MIKYKILFMKYKDRYDTEEYKESKRKVHQEGANLLLQLCLQNGGSFIKAGQFLAALTLALPKEYTTTLSVLQDRAPSHSWKETVKVFRDQFGVDPLEM